MQSLVVLLSALAAASASGLLGAPLLPKVQVGPTQVNVLRQPYTVQQPIPVHRSVPVPVKAVAHTAPIVESPILAAPALAYSAPAISTSHLTYAAAAPAITSYAAAAPAISTSHLTYAAAAPALAYSAPAISSHLTYAAAAPAISTSHWTYGAPSLAARTISTHGLISHSTLLAH